MKPTNNDCLILFACNTLMMPWSQFSFLFVKSHNLDNGEIILFDIGRWILFLYIGVDSFRGFHLTLCFRALCSCNSLWIHKIAKKNYKVAVSSRHIFLQLTGEVN